MTKHLIVTRTGTDFVETMVAFVVHAEKARVEAFEARENGKLDIASELEWLDAEYMVIATQYAAVIQAQSAYAVANDTGLKF